MNKENIEEILKNIGAEDVPADVHKIAQEASERFNITLTQPRQHILWEFIMKSRISKLAAAAVIIIAVLVGLYQFGDSIESVAWADVTKSILVAETVEYDIVISSHGKGQQLMHDIVVGPRIRRTCSNELVKDVVIDMESSKLLILVPEEKVAVYIGIKNFPEEVNHMRRLRNMIFELENDPDFAVKKTGVELIGGKPAVGFVASHPKKKLMVWADPHTLLPVRVEIKEEQIANVVCKNFKFDVDVDESLVSMEAPKGYMQEHHQIDLCGLPEEDLIKGLRLFAEFNAGEFPEDISVLHCMEDSENIAEKLETLQFHDREYLRLLMKWVRHILLLRYFEGPGQWHWAGAGVELGDTETPIYWYRPKDSSAFRLIYGDLHVEDVAEEDLPEPTLTERQAKIFRASEQWREREFVGVEKDRWHITASPYVVAHSTITLTKMSRDTNLMYIGLPYPTGTVESVTWKDVPIPFSEIARGRYELELPAGVLAEERARVECMWTIPVEALKKVDWGYWAKLRSLIPVNSFQLTFVLEQDCGFEYTKNPAQREIIAFKAGDSNNVVMDIGLCGIKISSTN